MPQFALNSCAGTTLQNVVSTNLTFATPTLAAPAAWIDTTNGGMWYSNSTVSAGTTYLAGNNQLYVYVDQSCLNTDCLDTPFIDVDEEDWAMNHDIYLQWARNRAVNFRVRTAEQRRQAEEILLQRRQREEEESRQKQESLKRSRELLLEHLTPAQRKTVEKNKWFIVTGGKTETRYRIRTDFVQGNIDVLRTNEDSVSHRLCCHCELYRIPMHDHHLAQKLSLELDEEHFLSVANRQSA